MVDGGGRRSSRIVYAIHRWVCELVCGGVGQAEGGLLMFFQSSGTGTWVIKHARVELGCIIGRQVLTNTNDLQITWGEKTGESH